MRPLFSSALLVSPPGAALAPPLALCRALLGSGGRVQLLTALELPLWEPDLHAALAVRLEQVEAEQAVMQQEVAAQGFKPGASLCMQASEAALAEAWQPVKGGLMVLHGFSEGVALRSWMDLGLRASIPLAWPGRRAVQPGEGVLLVLPPGVEDAAGLLPLLERLAPPELLLLSPEGSAPADALAEDVLEGLGMELTRLFAPLRRMGEALQSALREHSVGLVLMPSLSGAGSGLLSRVLAPLSEQLSCPVLLLPGLVRFRSLAPHWEGPDLVRAGATLSGWVEQVEVLGAQPVDGRARLLVRGKDQGELELRRGRWRSESPALRGVALLGLASVGEANPLGAALSCRVLRPGLERVALFDAALPPSREQREAVPGARQWWGVRLDPEQSFQELRLGLRAQGLKQLIDADELLGDGPPVELPSDHMELRLLRVARCLRARGVAVELVLTRAHNPVRAEGFVAAEDLRDPEALAAAVEVSWRAPGLGDPLLELCWAQRSTASALQLELHGGEAREQLLAQIRGAQRRVHLQTYMFHDDRVGRQIAGALAEAAARGVEVRVLVDSLWSLHGSFGQVNQVLQALGETPGVELRCVRPLSGLPSLDELKGRDHRKLLLVDGVVARIGGRNIGDSYYTGFDEVALHPQSPQEEVPWLDASASVRGAVVGELERMFTQAWVEAGGQAPEALDPGPPGALPLRVVRHEGLRDTCTLDAYRALIDGASRTLTVVNTFPFQRELLDALSRAVERGVKVTVLMGKVRPSRGDGQPFVGGVVRELATQVIHGRIDQLVAAGAQVYELGVPHQPAWDKALTGIFPHVHAKLLSVDGEVFTVGSANLDTTAGYWESEAMLIVEHPPSAQALDEQLAQLLAQSRKVDPEDEEWQRLAARRAWLARSWPSVMG